MYTKRMFLGGLALGVVCGVMLGAFWRAEVRAQESEEAELQWLSSETPRALAQIEEQFGGFSKTMWEVGYRFVELHNAGNDEMWPYAEYQLDKIEEAIRRGIERRPARAQSSQRFLNDLLPEVKEQVKQHDPTVFRQAMTQLRTGCMRCHEAEGLPFATVPIPQHRLSPIAPLPEE